LQPSDDDVLPEQPSKEEKKLIAEELVTDATEVIKKTNEPELNVVNKPNLADKKTKLTPITPGGKDKKNPPVVTKNNNSSETNVSFKRIKNLPPVPDKPIKVPSNPPNPLVPFIPNIATLRKPPAPPAPTNLLKRDGPRQSTKMMTTHRLASQRSLLVKNLDQFGKSLSTNALGDVSLRDK
jgi:hypothetical protein